MTTRYTRAAADRKRREVEEHAETLLQWALDMSMVRDIPSDACLAALLATPGIHDAVHLHNRAYATNDDIREEHQWPST